MQPFEDLGPPVANEITSTTAIATTAAATERTIHFSLPVSRRRAPMV
jgi:hypothetical protein